MAFDYLVVGDYSNVANHQTRKQAREHKWGRYGDQIVQTNNELAYRIVWCVDRNADVTASICDSALTGEYWPTLRDYWLPAKRIEVIYIDCGCT